MTHERILIAYGSRYNCTADISQKLANFLEERFNLKVSLLNLRETEAKSWPLLEREEYTGIIIGTGIRITKWTKEVRLFLKVNKVSRVSFKVFFLDSPILCKLISESTPTTLDFLPSNSSLSEWSIFL